MRPRIHLRFAAEGLLRVSGNRLVFPDEGSRFSVNGGWLEGHVCELLRRLRREVPQLQDLARSLAILRQSPRGDAIPNEIDVACLAENRLYRVACKTRGWRENRHGSHPPLVASLGGRPGLRGAYRNGTRAVAHARSAARRSTPPRVRQAAAHPAR